MMDKIMDFFKELKDRLNNPFISSFLISWLIINWRIVIGILFYGNSELISDGYVSKIDLISKNYSTNKCLIYPIFLAFGYTFAFPIFRNIVYAFNSWNSSWGSRISLKYSKKGKISVNKYIELRESYTERINTLEKTVEDESKLFIENASLKSKIAALTNENQMQNDLIMFIREKSNLNSFNGTWKMKYRTEENHTMNERVWISNGHISNSNQESTYTILFHIISTTYNPTTTEYVWIITRLNEKKVYFVIMRPTDSNNSHFLKSTNSQSVIMELEVT